jgi:hypothetical protein
MTTFLIILVILSLLSAGIILGMKKLAKKNVHFTQLGNEQGKLIVKGDNVVEVLSHMKNFYYDNNGELRKGNNPNGLGSLFKEFGIVFFGITPIKEVYKFTSEFKEYVDKKAEEITDKQPRYEIIKKKEELDYFKRFYTHAIEILRAELKDGSKIDLVFLVTFEIKNIIQVIFKIKPDGIILAQAETAFTGALNDGLRKYDYATFRDSTDKSDPKSAFVLNIISQTNEIIEEKFHLSVDLVEMSFFDLSKGEPGDEDFEKSQTLKKIAENEGDAKIIKAQKNAEAKKIDGEGQKAYYEEIAKVIGKKNIGSFANLEQVKDTNLVSYGSTDSKILLNVKPEDKK